MIPPESQVDVTLEANGRDCIVQIIDIGRGTDETFIRERLFWPFDSTKRSTGMGSGVHQLRDTVRQLRRNVVVRSSRGEGTTVTLMLDRVAASEV